MQGALGHGGEGLADEQLREWGLRVPHHRGQDVDGCLQGRNQAASGAGREGLGELPTLRRRPAGRGDGRAVDCPARVVSQQPCPVTGGALGMRGPTVPRPGPPLPWEHIMAGQGWRGPIRTRTHRTQPRGDLVRRRLHDADQGGDQPRLHGALAGLDLGQLLEDVLRQRGHHRV